MNRKERLSIFLKEDIWVILCGLAVGIGIAAIFLLRDITSLLFQSRPWHLVSLAAGSGFAVICGLYGIFCTLVLSRNRKYMVQGSQEAESLVAENLRLKKQTGLLRERVDELSTLREVACVVNRESDFEIAAEKLLTLVAGLFEPNSLTIFLVNEDDKNLNPVALCEWSSGKALFGRRIRTRTIPSFNMSMFDRFGIIVRHYTGIVHVIIPLKVDTEVLGAMLMVFKAGRQKGKQLTADFNGCKRSLLQEITQHISLAVKTKHLHTRAVVDGLTKLYTKQHFLEQLTAAIELARRKGDDLSLIFVDLDHFKHVNDNHGHLTGDIVLSSVAGRIKRSLRKYDTAYRYGGEELAVLLPRTPAEKAALIAERLRTRVQNMKVKGEDGKKVSVTISLGVSQLAKKDEPETLISRADVCLYKAKNSGRNRVVVQRPGEAA